MVYIFFYLGLLTSVATMVARDSRAERVKAHKETRKKVRAEADYQFKKARTIDSIAAAQQESRVLAREALVTAWSQREQEKFHRHTAWGQYAHIYTSPDWATSMQRFFGSHTATIDYSYSHVSHGFTSAGEVVDSPEVRFGKVPVLSDILLASKMAVTDGAEPSAGGEFLQQLAGIKMPFQSTLDTHQCSLSYQIGFARNRVQFGVKVPLRHQIRTVRAVPVLNLGTQELLNDRDGISELDNLTPVNDIFRSLYGVSVAAMMQDIACRKDMIYAEHLTHASVGDISFFTAVNFFPWRLDRWTVSAELIVPGEKEVDTAYFLPVVPESAGFLSGKISTGFVGRKTAIGAPHLMVSCQVYVPTSVKMRVPRMVNATNVTRLPNTEVFYNEVSFAQPRDISVPECNVPDFASQTAIASMRPGFAVDFRVGTVLHPFISPLVECDLYYHFHMRGSDELRSGLSVTDWYTAPLASVPYRAQHRLGVSIIYQPTAHCQLRTGINGVVAGRSMPLDITANASIGWSW